MGIMMKTMAARHDIETVVIKGQTLTVALYDVQPATVVLRSGLRPSQHAIAQVQAPYLRVGQMRKRPCRKPACATANVEHAEIAGLERVEDHAMRRPKEQRL